jgi:Cytochrome P450.
MGSEINAQASSESDYVRAVYDISTLVLERMMRPWLWPSLIFGLTRDGKRHEENLKILHGFTRRVIEERKAARAAGGVREGNDLDENFGESSRYWELEANASRSLSALGDGGKCQQVLVGIGRWRQMPAGPQI